MVTNESPNLPRNEDGTLPVRTDLGGYTIYYLDRQSSVLCADCANKQESEDKAYYADLDHASAAGVMHIPQFSIVAAGCNYEDCYLYCDECSARLPPSYLTDSDCEGCAEDDN